MEQGWNAVIIDNYYSSSSKWGWKTNANYFSNSANSFTLSVENWAQIALSISPGFTYPYKYEVLEFEPTWKLNYINQVSLILGVWKRENARYWKGVQDDIGIWNRALTAQEITKIYNGEKF
jgi:hypothetical protein